jgi:galactokinase
MSRTFFAPGRVNLIGEHTDYSGGLVLPAALELGIALEWTQAERSSLVSDQGSQDDLERYVGAVAAELAALGREPVWISGALTSDLPAGAGLSSSAALEVVIALSLCAAAEFELPPLELARACQRAEQRAVGVPSGIMDQAASLLGEPGHAVLINTATLAHESVPLPAGIVLLIVDSGVAHAHEGGGYALRRAELERATGGEDVGGLSLDDAEQLIVAREVDDVAARRLRHVVSENARVRRVLAALRAEPPDRAALGALFREGHVSLRYQFEVSTPELDALVDLAYEHGAVAARMTGGGFGGSIVALVDEARAAEIGEHVVDGYRRRTGIVPRAFVSRAAAGARALD